MSESFKQFPHAGLALDPIHVGTGGSRLGRVDNTIVRDPVTRIPKIPGSSLAGVMRAYAALKENKYPGCAGLSGHCGQADCKICTVFGFARGATGGFAGLAAFSDAHVLLFPVATREGPVWVTCPTALRTVDCEAAEVTGDIVLRAQDGQRPLNLGWLLLPVQRFSNGQNPKTKLSELSIPDHVLERIGVVSDKLFSHVVNSNLEVRTSVAINPETGAAEQGALFTYEALPRSTVLYWEITCRNPGDFKIGPVTVAAVTTPDLVHGVVAAAHSYMGHLGIGGMGTRGMGRLRVLNDDGRAEQKLGAEGQKAQ